MHRSLYHIPKKPDKRNHLKAQIIGKLNIACILIYRSGNSHADRFNVPLRNIIFFAEPVYKSRNIGNDTLCRPRKIRLYRHPVQNPVLLIDKPRRNVRTTQINTYSKHNSSILKNDFSVISLITHSSFAGSIFFNKKFCMSTTYSRKNFVKKICVIVYVSSTLPR